MATATSPRTRERRLTVESTPPAQKPRKRRRSTFLLALAILVALVWFLPALMIKTPLFGWGLRKATADLNGTVAIESVSAGWLTPISCRNVTVRDSQGEPVVTVPAVEGECTLAAMLWNYPNLGCFRIEKPKVTVAVRENGSNVDDLLANYFAKKDQAPGPSSSKLGMSLKIVEGGVTVTDHRHRLTKQLDGITLLLDMSSGVGTVTALELNANLVDPALPGKLQATMKGTSMSGEGSFVAEQIPLIAFQPVLALFTPKATLSGQLNGSVRAAWGLADNTKNGLQATVNVDEFAYSSPLLNIVEPRVEITAAGQWDSGQRRLQLMSAGLACSTIAVQGTEVVVSMPKDGATEVAGVLRWQTVLDRLCQCFVDRAKPAAWRIAGHVTGMTKFSNAAGRIRAENSLDAVNVAFADSKGSQFQEPQVRLMVQGNYDTKTSTMQLEQVQLQSSIVAADIKGTSATVNGEQTMQFDGQLGYDMERVSSLLHPYLGPNVRLTGRAASPAWYHGPFAMAKADAGAGIRWDRGEIYGLQVGPGELKAAINKGVVQISPFDVAVSQGQIHLAPQLRLTPEPMELTLPPGPFIQRIQLDSAICGSWVKYLVPATADASSTKGTISVALSACRIPLTELAKSEVAGQLVVHSAEVASGPFLRVLSTFLGRDVPTTLRQEMVVPFRVANGRVYHENLELNFPNFTIRTSGSVGFDQTLDLMAEMPVPTQWLQNTALASPLRNELIRIPISGTLTNPTLDKQVLDRVTKQFVHRAAETLIDNAVDQGLNRLFGPKK